MSRLDSDLARYLLDPAPMSIEELFAVEAKKLGNPRQVAAFISRVEQIDAEGLGLEISAVEMWEGSLAVVYKEQRPGTGQLIDWIGPRGHISRDRRETPQPANGARR